MDTLTTSIVINAIKSKYFEAHIKKDKFSGSGSGESYYSRGRSPFKRNHLKGKFHSKGRSASKGKGGNRKMFDGMVRTLRDFRFILELKKNLISQLDNSGLTYKAEGGILKVTKGSMVVIKVERKNGLYEMLGKTCVTQGSGGMSLVAEKDNTILWHRRLRHMPIEFKCPEEVWTGKLPCFKNLKTFGCVGYVHNKEGKLDPRSIKCIFLGYAEGVKGYRMWSLESKGTKLIISRDVIFNENEFSYTSVTTTNPAGSTGNRNSEKSQ
ncbi:hypothetical protein UlMin_030549 [Ulmus minor]